jgi:ech hydrogenase subunit A
MTSLIAFLIAFPLAVGAILLFVPWATIRNLIVVAASVVVAAASVLTVLTFGNGNAVFFGLPGDFLPGHWLLAAETAMVAFVVIVSIRSRRIVAPALALTQLVVSAWLDLTGRLPEVDPTRLFWFDRLSMIMVLIIGIVGTLICVNAVGYMRDYHRSSPMIRGRRTVFFSVLFVFLAGMFGLVVSNDLPMLLVFWEVTTLCSFVLIGYTRTKETVGYAFTALNMNLLGGLAFALAIALLSNQSTGLELSSIVSGPASGTILLAVALLSLAGITKSAQMPFSSWLLGAMYAPSPTSALLHSSTMVKAGVFLLLRLSPAMTGSAVGNMVALVGILTFLFASLVAVTEQNTKKVLAYSTIGSLGLIGGCAGIGSPELMWAGVMIIIFHALAKGLLFLIAGTVENRLYTKDIENFDTLLSRLPLVSALALTGIAGMFIAPFGVVVAKWAAIRAFLEVPGALGAVLLVIMAFGSSLTIFYWGKLLIKVLSMKTVSDYERSIEKRVSWYEWVTEGALAIGVIVVTASLGVISDQVVSPFARSVFPAAATSSLLPVEPAMLVTMLLAVLFLPALALWARNRGHFDEADFYAAGRSASAGHVMGAALGGTRTVTLRNYYLEGVVNGPLVFRTGTLAAAALLVAMVGYGMTVVR